MPGTKLFAQRSDTPPHPIYFRGDGVTMYLSGIVDPNSGRKRIIFELADSIGSGGFPDKLCKMLSMLGVIISVRECKGLLDAYEIRDFEETFKNVLLAAHASKRELFTAYVNGGKVPGTGSGKR